MSKKILELIPENLKEGLIKEVKEQLLSEGYTITEPGKDKARKEDQKQVDKDIQEWADKQKK